MEAIRTINLITNDIAIIIQDLIDAVISNILN